MKHDCLNIIHFTNPLSSVASSKGKVAVGAAPYWLRIFFQKAAFSRIKGMQFFVYLQKKLRRGWCIVFSKFLDPPLTFITLRWLWLS